jgi:hypothetical protein
VAEVADPPDIIGQIMAEVLTCAEDTLSDGRRPCDRVLLVPGELPAWDACCEGFLYVRLITMYPTAGGPNSPFPNQDTRPGNCKPTMMASQLGIGVLRCASTIDDNGVAPSAEVLTAEARGMTADASLVLAAIKCCVADIVTGTDSLVEQALLGSWFPAGPEGGCAGGEWTLTVAHGTCGC